jgi:hypothetical protein
LQPHWLEASFVPRRHKRGETFAMLMLYATAVGFAAAGLIGSLWAVVAGGSPTASMLFSRDLMIPLRVLVLVLHAPVMLLRGGMSLLIAGRSMGLAAIAAGGIWCFFEGVFILTQVFAIP